MLEDTEMHAYSIFFNTGSVFTNALMYKVSVAAGVLRKNTELARISGYPNIFEMELCPYVCPL